MHVQCLIRLAVSPSRQDFECTDLFESELDASAACEAGVPSQVFQPEATDRTR